MMSSGFWCHAGVFVGAVFSLGVLWGGREEIQILHCGQLFALGWRLLALHRNRGLRPCVGGRASLAGFSASRILSSVEMSRWR